MTKTILAMFAALFTMSTVAACNTMEGLGQDVQKGGENLEDAADENK